MFQKSIIFFIAALFLAAATTGCFRVTTATHERVDQELSGNGGYILGESTQERKAPRKKTKTFIKFEVDLSEFQSYGPPRNDIITEEVPSRKSAQVSKGVLDKGYLISEQTSQVENKPEPDLSSFYNEYEDIKIKEQPKKEVVTIYTVKKGETLWDIAARPEIYGSPSKWNIIFEANKDKIKKPSLIKPGMKLNIPR